MWTAAAFVLLVAWVSAGCGRGKSEDRRFGSLTKAFYADYFRINPTTATWIGEHRFDGRLNDASRSGIAEAVETYRSYLARLDAIDETKLSEDNRIDAEVLRNGIKLEVLGLEGIRDPEVNPTYYTNLLGNSINFLLERDFAPLDRRLDSAAERLGQFPRVVDDAIANLSNPSKVATETAIAQNRGLIALVRNDLLGVARTSPRSSRKVEKAAGPALEALQRYQSFLEGDLVNRSLGESRLGDALYRQLIDLMLQSDMTSDEIVSAAYAEIERVHDEMYDLAAPLYEGIAGKKPPQRPTAPERNAVVRRVLDEISLDHPKADELLDRCRADYAEASAFVRERKILALPQETLEIIWTPEYSRGVGLTALENPGPLDRSLGYYFCVSPMPQEFDWAQQESYLREYNTQMLRLVTIHEAMPGHFVQLAYANRNPSIVRAIFPNTAFIEGWAVYCMDLMTSLGFGGDDPRLKLEWRKYYLRVLTNAILDAGMHRQGMTEREAIELLTEDGFQEAPEAAMKWRRIGLMPGYVSTYFAGYLDMRALRLEVEDREGTGFDLARFHETLLERGALPPRLARRAFFGE
jgi:uncharacterized protein (DUF885 family)